MTDSNNTEAKRWAMPLASTIGSGFHPDVVDAEPARLADRPTTCFPRVMWSWGPHGEQDEKNHRLKVLVSVLAVPMTFFAAEPPPDATLFLYTVAGGALEVVVDWTYFSVINAEKKAHIKIKMKERDQIKL